LYIISHDDDVVVRVCSNDAYVHVPGIHEWQYAFNPDYRRIFGRPSSPCSVVDYDYFARVEFGMRYKNRLHALAEFAAHVRWDNN
jgi:hypothetical protein